MHVISRKKLKSHWQAHAETRKALEAWHTVMSESRFSTFEDLRSAFPQVDYVRPFHVFNIGRSTRLIAAIHFNRQKVFIRHVLTHAEYDRGKWKVK